MADRYYDLDADRDSLVNPTFKIAGQEWQFPADPPADNVFAYFGLFRFGVLPTERHREAYSNLLGEDTLSALLSAGAGWKQIDRLAELLLIEWGIAQGRPTAPEAAAGEESEEASPTP